MRDKSENEIRIYGTYNTAELILRPPERTEWIQKTAKILYEVSEKHRFRWVVEEKKYMNRTLAAYTLEQ